MNLICKNNFEKYERKFKYRIKKSKVQCNELDLLKISYMYIAVIKNKTEKGRRTMQFKGQAGSTVFRSSALLLNSQVNRSWLL